MSPVKALGKTTGEGIGKSHVADTEQDRCQVRVYAGAEKYVTAELSGTAIFLLPHIENPSKAPNFRGIFIY